jgi:hypothetical protein
MSVNLIVQNGISTALQAVQDSSGTKSALNLASNEVVIEGQDIVGAALPLQVAGLPVSAGEQTFGRLLRLYSQQLGTGGMYDFAVDAHGNLLIYAGGQTATAALTISPNGAVTIPNLTVKNLVHA